MNSESVMVAIYLSTTRSQTCLTQRYICGAVADRAGFSFEKREVKLMF